MRSPKIRSPPTDQAPRASTRRRRATLAGARRRKRRSARMGASNGGRGGEVGAGLGERLNWSGMDQDKANPTRSKRWNGGKETRSCPSRSPFLFLRRLFPVGSMHRKRRQKETPIPVRLRRKRWDALVDEYNDFFRNNISDILKNITIRL